MSDAANSGNDAADTFEVLDCRPIHKGFHDLDLMTVRQRRLDGSWTPPLKREVYRHHASVGILLHDPRRGKVVLVEQPRLPAHVAGRGDRVIQVVAGFIDGDEAAETAATREVMEEAGLSLLAPPRLVVRAMTTPGAVSEVCTLFYGEIDASLAQTAGGLASEEEETRLVILDQPAMIAAMERGQIFDGVTSLLGWWLQAQILSGAVKTA